MMSEMDMNDKNMSDEFARKIAAFLAEKMKSRNQGSSQLKAGDFINDKEACLILNVRRVTLYKMRKRGDIPFTSVNGRIRYERRVIEAYLRSRLSGGQKRSA